jgi:hypothetical protein
MALRPRPAGQALRLPPSGAHLFEPLEPFFECLWFRVIFDAAMDWTALDFTRLLFWALSRPPAPALPRRHSRQRLDSTRGH